MAASRAAGTRAAAGTKAKAKAKAAMAVGAAIARPAAGTRAAATVAAPAAVGTKVKAATAAVADPAREVTAAIALAAVVMAAEAAAGTKARVAMEAVVTAGAAIARPAIVMTATAGAARGLERCATTLAASRTSTWAGGVARSAEACVPKAALVPRQAAFEVLQVVCWSLSQFRFPGGFSANRDKQVLCRDFDSKNEPEIFSLGARANPERIIAEAGHHRARIMDKTQARSFSELVRLALGAGHPSGTGPAGSFAA